VSEEKAIYHAGCKVDEIKQATLTILDDLDDIDKQSIMMWGNDPLHANVVQIKAMTKEMRDAVEEMIYNSIQ